MAIQEREQVDEPVLNGHLHVELLYLLGDGADNVFFFFRVIVLLETYFDVILHQFVAERFDFGVHCGGDEVHSDEVRPEVALMSWLFKLAICLLSNELETLIHFLFKTHIEHSVSFIKNHGLKIIHFQTLCILKMV